MRSFIAPIACPRNKEGAGPDPRLLPNNEYRRRYETSAQVIVPTSTLGYPFEASAASQALTCVFSVLSSACFLDLSDPSSLLPAALRVLPAFSQASPPCSAAFSS